jgi:hypothetical protein
MQRRRRLSLPLFFVVSLVLAALPLVIALLSGGVGPWILVPVVAALPFVWLAFVIVGIRRLGGWAAFAFLAAPLAFSLYGLLVLYAVACSQWSLRSGFYESIRPMVQCT